MRRSHWSTSRPLAAALITVPLIAGLSGCGGGSQPSDQAAGPAAGRPADASAAQRPAELTAGVGAQPRGRVISGLPVDRVVDGDTLHVIVDGQDVTVRMIGIDTPETVKPDSPVECFGPEASAFAAGALTGQTVTLELDESQGSTDQYGRTLAYVWVEEADGSLALFNLAAVAGGYAEERQYGSTPFAWAAEFRAAEDEARAAGRGLWGACD